MDEPGFPVRSTDEAEADFAISRQVWPDPNQRICDQPDDVLQSLTRLQASGQNPALVVVTRVEGGAVRDPGALMLVGEDASTISYISNGCVDADIAQQAVEAMKDGKARTARYGAGSPYVDIRLPCGGAIEVLMIPDPDRQAVAAATSALARRNPVALTFCAASGLALGKTGSEGDPGAARGVNRTEHDGARLTCTYRPRLRLRIVGRGANMLALTRLAAASGLDVAVLSPDTDDLRAARQFGANETQHLVDPDRPSGSRDDARTAVVFMFHEHEWETTMLQEALRGRAFFIGAMGSRRTHQQRLAQLATRSVSQKQLDRIRGPIGLIPRTRDATAALKKTMAANRLGKRINPHPALCGRHAPSRWRRARTPSRYRPASDPAPGVHLEQRVRQAPRAPLRPPAKAGHGDLRCCGR